MLKSVQNREDVAIFRDACGNSAINVAELLSVAIMKDGKVIDEIAHTPTTALFMQGKWVYNLLVDEPIDNIAVSPITLSFFPLSGYHLCSTNQNTIITTEDYTQEINSYEYVFVNGQPYKIVKHISTGNSIKVPKLLPSGIQQFKFAHKEDITVLNTSVIRNNLFKSIDDSFGCKDCGNTDAPADLCLDVVRYIALQNALTNNKTTEVTNLVNYFNNKYKLKVLC
jgi:hypothetical protein